MSINDFINEIKKLGYEVSKEQLNQLEIYKNFMQEYNTHTNLTRIINDEDVYLKHFYDSLTIIKYIDLNKYSTLLDLGTGAGFPGMILKIFYPNLKVTLLDSNNKKINFLKELSNKLNISVELVHDRSENYINNKRECFDIVVSRAMANLNSLLELSIPYVKINGYFIAMKGQAVEELENSKNIEKILGAEINSINEFDLKGQNRTIILYKKKKKTDNKYPRAYDKIKKNPIKC